MALPYAQLAASTIKNFKRGFVDNIIADSILLTLMGSPEVAPRVRRSRDPKVSGAIPPGLKFEDAPGRKIFFPLMYAKNGTVQSYSGFDVLDTSPQDLFTAAEYDWASISGSLHISMDELDQNTGSAVQLFNLLEGHIDALRISMSDDITDKLLGIKASGSKDPLGLMDLVKDDPTTDPASGDLGGIDSVANSFWRNQAVDHGGGAFGTDQTGDGMKNVRQLLRDVTFGSQSADVMLAGESAFDAVENTMVNQIRYTNEATRAVVNAGFDAITVKGTPFVMEKKITSIRSSEGLSGDAIYALNLDFLKIFAMSQRWFEPSKMKEPVNQDTLIQHVITRLQFATNGRRYQGVLFNIPTT